ncbi:MAG TPA: MoaD/ThiS family protein [Candidatus Wallbacteria bacterium]|nr:MoaD/ThiS family protein [Candidatus Wallbacteria bacterium]
MKLKLTLLLHDRSFIQNNQYITRAGGPDEYELACEESLLAEKSGHATLEGLLNFLRPADRSEIMFIIINKKITFSNVRIFDGDHIELIPAIDGG